MSQHVHATSVFTMVPPTPSTLSAPSIIASSHMTVDQVEYACGMGAAVCSVLVTFPINKIVFRQSMWGVDAFDAMRQLYREGFFTLFRGCLPPVVIKSINSSVMFGTYHQFYQWLITNPKTAVDFQGRELKTAFVAALMSGSTEAMFAPFERVQGLLQDGRQNDKYSNTMDVFRKLRPYGIAEYYRGLSIILLRNGPATFMYFGFKDRLKEALLPSNSLLFYFWGNSRRKEAFRNFISGALLGSAISTFIYPLNGIKIQMMMQEVGSRHLSIIRAAYNLYQERGGKLDLMFSGIHANLTRSFLYWGCITVFSEMFREYFTSE